MLVQSLELPDHLYQRHLDYLEDKVSALKPYFKIERAFSLTSFIGKTSLCQCYASIDYVRDRLLLDSPLPFLTMEIYLYANT